MTWTDGYISDVRYPAFFYKEMQPLWLTTVASLLGVTAPMPHMPFVLCELGCGVGINLLVSAACHPQAQFVGVDFNADHLAFAHAAAEHCGLDNVEFVHADFSTFAKANERTFDFVTSHGAWSWIAPEHRAALLDCVSQALKPGGLFYLHYMCHPGSTEMLPLQHLLNLCAHHMPGPSPRKAQTGMMLVQQLLQGGLYADKPAMLVHVANLARREPADLAHEFLTDHWTPQHSVDVHQQVAETGLAFLGSADVFNNLDLSLSIPGRLQDIVRRTAVPALAETLKDMARGAHQRMDMFQRDAAAPGAQAMLEGLRGARFRLLPGAPAKGPVTFTTPIGPITGPEAVFTSLLERLASGPASWEELLALPVFSGNAGMLLQSLQLLMMQGLAHPAMYVPPSAQVRAQALSQWFESNGIALTVLPDCATAVAP
ncbi:class I SAM-dependent methyltransferase [Novosphingobium kaempferiae]|uniref:class I SAM-dependent methyltransferase n=1 Tax=Novosphingobium kaempferiae TaxID=2896849 RepID=UPI001E578888|nr:class I SAM-dependent methyltransferase [Novosphingobium kaempferiae]